MAIHRRTNGISGVSSSNPWAQYNQLDPTLWSTWTESWLIYDTAQSDTPEWTLTNTNTGGVDAVVTPGVLTLTLDGGNDDACCLQMDHGHYFLTSGKRAIFETRIKLLKGSGANIDDLGFVVGLCEVATSTNFMDDPPPTALAFADGWGFLSYDATTNIVAFQGENDVFSTEAGCTTYADDTWMVLSIYWDGSKSTFYKDDVELCQITSNPPTSVVVPSILISAGEAVADVLYVDYMVVAIER